MTCFNPSPDLFKPCLKPLLHHRRARGLLMGIYPRGCVTSLIRCRKGVPRRVPVDTGDWTPSPWCDWAKTLVRLGQNPQGRLG
jgi:hypothetical protein